MTQVTIVLRDIKEEIVSDTGDIRSSRTLKFHEFDSKARGEIEAVLGKGDETTLKVEKQSRGHSFGGHDVLQTVVSTAYVAGIAKVGQTLVNGLKAWTALNKGREVKISYEAKSGKRKEIKITGYSAKNAEQIFELITDDTEQHRPSERPSMVTNLAAGASAQTPTTQIADAVPRPKSRRKALRKTPPL